MTVAPTAESLRRPQAPRTKAPYLLMQVPQPRPCKEQ